MGALENLSFVWPGPRKFTSLVLDKEDNPWRACSDKKTLTLAVWDGSTWQTQTVVNAGEGTLGQIIP